MESNLDRINSFNLDQLVRWRDILWGIGQVALEFITERHAHEGLSDHFVTITPDNVDILLPPGE